jgi:hypothetical protein
MKKNKTLLFLAIMMIAVPMLNAKSLTNGWCVCLKEEIPICEIPQYDPFGGSITHQAYAAAYRKIERDAQMQKDRLDRRNRRVATRHSKRQRYSSRINRRCHVPARSRARSRSRRR